MRYIDLRLYVLSCFAGITYTATEINLQTTVPDLLLDGYESISLQAATRHE
jgi:hypothetical protein